jgi:hypothetical protein
MIVPIRARLVIRSERVVSIRKHKLEAYAASSLFAVSGEQ